ncbi:hypothetical protein GTA08_BOTSDO14018 [Neofusicoccum parvum]|nr:hypothetical protein GTA08_BOTSDO14018 [Neofusicoccum parvum]
MKCPIVLSTLFASTAFSFAFTPPTTKTYTVAIPTGGVPYTTTLPPCGTVNGYVLVAEPNSPFVPGTTTIFVPPQASPVARTFTNEAYNLTQVIVMEPLDGACAPKDLGILTPSAVGAFNLSQYTATGIDLFATGVPISTGSAAACPSGYGDETVEGEHPDMEPPPPPPVDAAVHPIIDGLNQATIIAQNLDTLFPAAEQIGTNTTTTTLSFRGHRGRRQSPAALEPALQLLDGLRQVGMALRSLQPRLTALAPFKEDEADKTSGDAVVRALGTFVRVQQGLLNTLVGRARVIRAVVVPAGRGAAVVEKLVAAEGAIAVDVDGAEGRMLERVSGDGLVAAAVAAVLRALKGVVDSVVYDVGALVPARLECVDGLKEAVNAALDEAIKAYD